VPGGGTAEHDGWAGRLTLHSNGLGREKLAIRGAGAFRPSQSDADPTSPCSGRHYEDEGWRQSRRSGMMLTRLCVCAIESVVLMDGFEDLRSTGQFFLFLLRRALCDFVRETNGRVFVRRDSRTVVAG